MNNPHAMVGEPQDVFRLRKEGKLGEALALAETLSAQSPNDLWVVRALAWCLYDQIKALGKAGDTKAVSESAFRLRELKLPPEDVLLNQQVAFALRMADPRAQVLTQASELSKAGRHGDAVRLARPVAQHAERNLDIAVAYGWILYRKLKASDPVADLAARVWCFDEFRRCWNQAWNPEPMLWKYLLLEATKNAANWDGVADFVSALDLAKINEKDWVDERPGVDFAPFHQQVLKTLYQNLKLHPRRRESYEGLNRWFVAWGEKLEGEEWADYHLGRLLVWTHGDLVRAKRLLLGTVKRNPAEFWRWSALADTVPKELKLSVVARAAACPCADASFKLPLLQELAGLLAAAGHISAAISVEKEYRRLLQLSGKEFKGESPSWFRDDQEISDQTLLLEGLAASADELLHDALPDVCGVIAAKLPPKEGRKGEVFLCCIAEKDVIRVKFQGAESPAIGSAFVGKISFSEDGISKVFKWSPSAIPRDIGAEHTGIVTGCNLEKQLLAVATSEHAFVPLSIPSWPDARKLSVGTYLRLRLFPNREDRPPLVLHWETMPNRSDIHGLTKAVQGRFQRAPGKPFGFIQNGSESVFVPPSLAKGLEEGAVVSGLAVRSKDKHDRPSWALLAVD